MKIINQQLQDKTKIAKIASLKSIEYLDLQIRIEKRFQRVKPDNIIKCNFENGNHSLHTEDAQYNTLIDLIINLSEKIKESNNRIIKILSEQEEIQIKQKQLFSKIENNLDYFKEQGIDLNEKLNELKNRSKEEISNTLIIKTQETKTEVASIKEIVLS